jgi:hypothetical protein
MMEAELLDDPETIIHVLPRTLGIRPLKSEDGEAHGVYGSSPGNVGNVWVATFFDHQEAQAWIMASNAFGQPIRGTIINKPIEVIDGPGIPSRKPSNGGG